jgi:hypothetical protein
MCQCKTNRCCTVITRCTYTLNWRYQYMAWCGVQAAVEALLPLWALAPLLTGGLQLTPQHTGVALAAAGAALATAHIGTDDLCAVSYVLHC